MPRRTTTSTNKAESVVGDPVTTVATVNVNGLRGVRAALDLRGMCVLWIGCARIRSHGDGVDAVCRACMRGCRVRERGAVKRRVPDLAFTISCSERNDHASSFRRMGHPLKYTGSI